MENEIIVVQNTSEEATRKKRLWKTIIFYIGLVLLCVVIAYILSKVLFITIPVKGQSMEPTLQHEDRVLLYKVGKYKHGDIVVFDSGKKNSDGSPRYFIKRIIGLQGDTIEIKEASDGEFYVYKNGEKLVEKYLDQPLPRKQVDARVVQEGEFYYLGDNRANSTDSADGEIGKIGNILGRAIISYHGDNFFNQTKVIPRVKYNKTPALHIAELKEIAFQYT